jgi:hypothetical protein
MQSNLGEMEMLEMRVLFAVLLVVLGIAGVDAVCAADLPADRTGVTFTGYGDGGYRAEPLVVYDDQPGVGMRAYWLAPWRNHHYYPTNGRRPKIGRAENLSAVSRHLPEAQTFQRSWSTPEASYVSEPVRHRVQPRYADPELPLEAPLK